MRDSMPCSYQRAQAVTSRWGLSKTRSEALMRGVHTLQDLMRTPAGSAFVRQHLTTPDLQFETRPGSLSRDKLLRYRSRHHG
jgi:hypothetical protein